MKLKLSEILERIGIYANDYDVENYETYERLIDINDEYQKLYTHIDLMKNKEWTSKDSDNNIETVILPAGETLITISSEAVIRKVVVDGKRCAEELTTGSAEHKCCSSGNCDTCDIRYIRRDGNIELTDSSTKDRTIELYMNKGLTMLSDDDDIPRLPDVAHLLLVFGSIKAYFTKRDMSIPSYISNEYKERFDLMKQKYRTDKVQEIGIRKAFLK